MTHRLVLEPNPPRGKRQTWRVWLGDELLLEASPDPEHQACRALQERGLGEGKIQTWIKGAEHPSLSMGVAWGAARRTADPDKGNLHVEKYQKLDANYWR